MLLTSTSDIVRIVTASAVDIDIQAGWADNTTTAFTGGRTNTKVTTATTTTIVASPAASTQRQVKTLVIRNVHGSSSNLVTVQHYDGTTSVTVYKYTLLAGESILYTGNEWIVYDSTGVPISLTSTSLADGDYGDITVGGSGTTFTIDNAAVTLAKMADLAANSIIGNNTGAGATPIALTAAQVRTLLSLVIGTNVQAWDADLDLLAARTSITLNSATSALLKVINSTDAASNLVASFESDRATPTANDSGYIDLVLSDSAGNQDPFARITWTGPTVTNGATQDGKLILSVLLDNVMTDFIRIDGSGSPKVYIDKTVNVTGDMAVTGSITGVTGSVRPDGAGADLGTLTQRWTNFFLDTTADIEWNGDTYLTRLSAGVLAIGGVAIPSLSSADTLTNKTYDLGENTPIVLDTALSADGKYSGIVEAGTAGATLAFGDLVYLQTSDSRWELVDANAEATCKNKLGICVLAAAADGSATTILLIGKVRADAVFPALTIGAPVFAGTTAGDIQTTAPSGAADIIRIIGYGNTADELYFDPSPDYFEHV